MICANAVRNFSRFRKGFPLGLRIWGLGVWGVEGLSCWGAGLAPLYNHAEFLHCIGHVQTIYIYIYTHIWYIDSRSLYI